jgi:DNA-binding response OmpR family regulator
MYGEYLRHHRLEVDGTETPEDALDLLNRQAPDVIVTELVFARRSMTGPTFIQTARRIVDDATSIIVVSGFVRFEDREVAREAGADLFLTKPALPRDVLYQIRRALAAKIDGGRLSWNWTQPPADPPSVDRRTYSLRAPLSMASDRPRRCAKA